MNRTTANSEVSINRIGTIILQVAGPALAIVAVSSVAFFLIEVTYSGAFVSRIKWIFALFSFAAVLISRISIEEGFERASMFGLLLAMATLLVTARLIQGNALLLGPILIFVWWVAGRLTWDCTFIDETRDATGQGMIDLAIERVRRSGKKKSPSTAATPVREESEPPHSLDSAGAPKPPTAWDTFVGIFWKRKQPNTPGLWAFYFLLAGLPLFGLGQLMMRMNDADGQRAAAWHFSTYMIALLGLLMLSSILGLHRYLKKNNSSVPPRVARRWMVTGTLLAVGIVGFCFLLPRPTPQYSIARWLPQMTSRNLNPSKNSVGQDGQKQGKGNANVNAGPRSRDGQQKPQDRQGGDSGGNAKQGKDGSPQSKKGARSGGGESSGGKQGSGGPKQKSGSGDDSRKKSGQSDQKNDGRKKGKGGDSREKSKNASDQDQSEKGDPEKSDSAKGKSDSAKGNSPPRESKKNEGLKSPSQKKQAAAQKKKKRQQSGSSAGQKSRQNRPPSETSKEQKKQESPRERQDSGLFRQAGKFVKFLMWLVAAAVIGWFAIRHRDQIMPWIRSFLAELAEFWHRLWNRPRKPPATRARPESSSRRPATRLPGFPQFQNPFQSGAAQSWSPERLVRYTFQALEAWSRDQQCPREPEQTAHEFARETGQQYQPLASDLAGLANLYAQLAYADGQITRAAAMTLSGLWEKLARLHAPAG